uniref:MgtE domain-containing protein n=1 Tax=Loa loa TaxID=7209 RepID=A0A1I7VDQ7_LOALO
MDLCGVKKEETAMEEIRRRSESVTTESIHSTLDSHQGFTQGDEREKTILISVLKQTLLPFFIAGLGQICIGLFFERAQHWWYFLYVPETFILVPALLGLKGNLEITYASRFCTLSNAGKANKTDEIFFIARFNLCLIEVQAIVLSFFAALLSSAISLINCNFKQSHAIVVLSSGIYTASLSSFFVGFLMITIVVSTRRYGIDPDNIAAPLTATSSDFITLIMLEPRTRLILRDSWFAVTAAIVVGCCSGLLLQSAIVVFPGIAALHPLITGLAGNRVSVQSSRLATALHLSEYSLGKFPAGTTIWTFVNPLRFFCLRRKY